VVFNPTGIGHVVISTLEGPLIPPALDMSAKGLLWAVCTAGKSENGTRPQEPEGRYTVMENHELHRDSKHVV
jgi:hypothetical protein